MNMEQFRRESFERQRIHIEYLKAEGLDVLRYPLSFWTTDSEGEDMIVTAVHYRGFGKWLCVDEDGEYITCNNTDLKNPTM